MLGINFRTQQSFVKLSCCSYCQYSFAHGPQCRSASICLDNCDMYAYTYIYIQSFRGYKSVYKKSLKKNDLKEVYVTTE